MAGNGTGENALTRSHACTCRNTHNNPTNYTHKVAWIPAKITEPCPATGLPESWQGKGRPGSTGKEERGTRGRRMRTLDKVRQNRNWWWGRGEGLNMSNTHTHTHSKYYLQDVWKFCVKKKKIPRAQHDFLNRVPQLFNLIWYETKQRQQLQVRSRESREWWVWMVTEFLPKESNTKIIHTSSASSTLPPLELQLKFSFSTQPWAVNDLC